MNKKIVSGILVFGLILSFAVFTSADINVIDSMDFQGDAITLSLEEAIDRARNESVSGKSIDWNEEKAVAAYWEYTENAKAINAGWDTANTLFRGTYPNEKKKAEAYANAELIQSSISSTRSDAEILKFTGEFYKDQRLRNKTAEENMLNAQVKELYFTVNNLNELVTVNKENVEVRQKLYDDTQTKFELGMVAKQDVLSAEYELMSAQTDYEESVVNLKNVKMKFNLLLGYDPMQEVVLTDTISENAEEKDIGIADAVSKALLERNEIYAAKFQLDLSEMTMESLKKKSTSASEVKKQRVALEESTEKYVVALDDVEIDVRGKYMDMMQKKSAVETSKKSVESLEEALRLTQLTYDSGMAILTDVQEIQTKVFQAKVGLSNAILDYNLAVDAFEESMGAGRFTVPLS